jgi:hypothetical protein
MIEARSLHIIVSSDHPSADEQVAEAIARVVSRYAVDLTPEIEVNVPQAGIKVPYVANALLFTPPGGEKSEGRFDELILRRITHIGADCASHPGTE